MRHCDKQAVTVNITNKCNLRCHYCMASSAEEQATPRFISLDFALAGIDDALSGHPTGIKAKCLRFFSPGEPTQGMEILRRCVVHAKRTCPEIQTELQTNGLFPDQEATDWLADNIDIVWFSLDGWPEINDHNRPDAFGRGRTREIEANLRKVSTKAQVGVRCTLPESSFDLQAKLVEYYHGLGVINLSVNPVIQQIRRGDSEDREVFAENLFCFAAGFITAHERAAQLGVQLVNSFTFNFDEPTEVACRSCLPMPQLNPDGSVSSCDMALYGDTRSQLDCFLYGQWDPATGRIAYLPAKIDYLQNRRYQNLPACRRCECAPYCAGGCAGRVAYQTGDIYQVFPEFCRLTRYFAQHLPLGEKNLRLTHP